MNKFQLITLILFIIFAVIGVFFFSTFRGEESIKDVEITIWGTEKASIFTSFLSEFRRNTNQSFSVSYKEIDKNRFAEEVVEAIAQGGGPDIILISSNDLLRFEDKVLKIPFETISERSFKEAFIEGGEIFLVKDGILGLPITIDPLVMYWNRDILQSNGISTPPKSWSEFFPLASRITQKDNALNIIQSAVAMGEYQNVRNAKEIIISMMLQNDNEIIFRNQSNGSLEVLLAQTDDISVSPAESVLKFYTEFSNPSKTSYSWNRSLPNSFEAFTAGDLALYFGFSSELPQIKAKNPNLNFSPAPFPQPSESTNKKVYGEVKALSVIKRSKNPEISVLVLSALVRDDNLKILAQALGLASAKRTLLQKPEGANYQDLFYESALIAKPFLDPDPKETSKIFQGMVERVVSGRERITQAVKRATFEFQNLIKEK